MGVSVPTNFSGRAPKIDPTNATMLLIDHQSGLFQTVKDMPMTELRASATTLARVATLMKIPIITTASIPWGLNGPLTPETYEAAPCTQYIAHKGEINTWGNPEFVAAVEATSKKQPIVVGTIISVCMALPSTAVVHDGYQVFVVIGTSSTCSKMAQEVTPARVVQAGMAPMDTAVVYSGIQRTWNRDDAVQFAEAYSTVSPHYQLLIESYAKAQAVVNNHEQLDSQRE